ncbi:SMP-30/gluconolactonase/LRE family protein [Sphingobacterium sp. E70]|nr:SMP-30/gluconolactonase/LRE family protein [Sphingobacterium sp. E70]ULT23727.1 SMP-30/gluconolactonase/LRE family protein [Sphingobacterium sp. E70]
MERNVKTAQVLLETKSLLGEGILWNKHDQSLYWVDILQKHIHQYNLENNVSTFWELLAMSVRLFLWKKMAANFSLPCRKGWQFGPRKIRTCQSSHPWTPVMVKFEPMTVGLIQLVIFGSEQCI